MSRLTGFEALGNKIYNKTAIAQWIKGGKENIKFLVNKTVGGYITEEGYQTEGGGD